jgi:hypothetical protein
MQLPILSESDMLRERYTERWALKVCRGATFIQCLKKFAIAPTITVSTPKGKSLAINTSDIYAARKRFFAASLDLEQDVCHMTAVGDKLVDLYQDWLLHEYSDRYHYVIADAHRKWLKQVIILVVARHLMEQKYSLFNAEGRQTFADAWACSVMCRLQLLNSLPSELARLVHHIMKDPEQKQEFIDQFHSDLDIRMSGYLFIASEPLPPLLEGVILPFALLSQGEETHDE